MFVTGVNLSGAAVPGALININNAAPSSAAASVQGLTPTEGGAAVPGDLLKMRATAQDAPKPSVPRSRPGRRHDAGSRTLAHHDTTTGPVPQTWPLLRPRPGPDRERPESVVPRTEALAVVL